MIIKIEKSDLYPGCFSIRDTRLYEAKKKGEPIILETPEGQLSEPINPDWVLRNIKPYPQKGYFEKPMMFYRTPYKVLSKEEKEEKSKQRLIEAMM